MNKTGRWAGESKSALIAYVTAHPGATKQELLANVPILNDDYFSNVARLVRQGSVHTEGKRRHARYYPGPAPVQAPAEPVAWFGPVLAQAPTKADPVLLTEDDVLAYITEHPGHTASELEQQLGDVAGLIGSLKQKGSVVAKRISGLNRYYESEYYHEQQNQVRPPDGQTKLMQNYGQRRDQVIELVTAEPGITRRAINTALGKAPDSTDLSIARWVKMGLIQVRTRGVLNYYYPKGYEFDGTEGNVVPRNEPHPAHGGKHAMRDIEALAKTFVWETGSTNLREFVNWSKSHETTN